jgi:hypothetical protein
MVVAIGFPGYQFGTSDEGGRLTSYHDATWWLPVDLPYGAEGGEAITEVSGGWAFWFRHVKRYDWFFLNKPELSQHKQPLALRAYPNATLISARWEPVARTRFGAPVGGSAPIVRSPHDGPGYALPFRRMADARRIRSPVLVTRVDRTF